MAFTVGWVYNLHDATAKTQAPKLIAIALAFPIIAVLAVSLRFGIRIKTGRKIQADDYAVLSSCILGIAYSILAIYQTRWGQALAASAFPAVNYTPFSKVQYAGGPVYIYAILGFKLSLLFSYLRFISHQRIYRIAVYGVMGLCVANQFAFSLVLTLACNPVAKQWDATITGGSCIDEVASYYALAGSSLGLDILIVLLPIPIVWKLNLNTLKQRVALILVFSMGLFVTIIQIVRIFTIANLKSYTDSEGIVSWSIVEINLGIVVASAPTYAPLLRYASEKLGSSKTRRDYTYGNGRAYMVSGGAGNKSQSDGMSKSMHTNKVDHGYDFALGDMRSKTAPGTGMKNRNDPDNESQEEILKLEDGIRIATSITQVESDRARDSESGGAEEHMDGGRRSRAAANRHGW